MSRPDRRAYLTGLSRPELRKALARMSDRQRRSLRTHWQLWAHPGQLPPPGEWLGWLIMAGRGFGKTRAGAEWVRSVAENDPTARIALIAASLGEARSVMVEGQSGLLAISPWGKRPMFEPSKRLLTWQSGAQATLYSAGEPESLRGPQHSHACRAGPEGGLRQRGPLADRCAAPLCHRKRNGNSASCPARWSKLAGWRGSDRGLERAGRQDCLPPGRELAIRAPPGRHAPVQPCEWAGCPLFG